MFENYSMPRLQKPNLKAAYAVCNLLQQKKFLSDESFKDAIRRSKGTPCQILPQNFDNIIIFLVKHKMVTKESINGLVCWAATQKCFRSQTENWFIVKQKVSKFQIEGAKDYQKINNGKLPFELEAGIIANNIFNLTGETKNEFISKYVGIMEYLEFDDFLSSMDRAIINPLNDIKTIDAPYIK